MNRTDRLTGIILALQHGRQTAARLAERFEVSRRTILRDIDALCEIGVPVISLPGAGGGLELDGDYWLKPVQLSGVEAAALLLGARGLGLHPDAPLAQAGRSAVDKLRGALNATALAEADRDLALIEVTTPRHPDRLKPFGTIQEAITSGSWVRTEYQSLRRVAIHHLHPRSLSEQDGFWYCAAVSLEAGATRQYRLDRMVTVALIAPPEGAEAAVVAATRLGPAYDDPAHPEVAVRLTYQGARLAEDLPHLDHNLHQTSPDTWELRFRCPPGELPYFARVLLGFGPAARVLAPDALRIQIRGLALAVADAHQIPTLSDEGDTTVSPSVS